MTEFNFTEAERKNHELLMHWIWVVDQYNRIEEMKTLLEQLKDMRRS